MLFSFSRLFDLSLSSNEEKKNKLYFCLSNNFPAHFENKFKKKKYKLSLKKKKNEMTFLYFSVVDGLQEKETELEKRKAKRLKMIK